MRCRHVLFALILMAVSVFALALPSGFVAAAPPNPAALNWEQGPAVTPISQAAAYVLGDRLYLAGGISGFAPPLSDAASIGLQQGRPDGVWRPEPAMPQGRMYTAVATTGDSVFLAGGYDGSAILDSVVRWQRNGTDWLTEGKLPGPRDYAAAAVINDRLYVAGGRYWGGNGVAADVWSAGLGADGGLNLDTGWRTEASMPREMVTSLVASGQCLYLVGGNDGLSFAHDGVYVAQWDPDGVITGWPVASHLPQPVGMHAALARDSVLYVLGGRPRTYPNPPSVDMVYAAPIASDCSLGAWSTGQLPGGERSAMATASSAHGIYMLGGGSSGLALSEDFWFTAWSHTPRLYLPALAGLP